MSQIFVHIIGMFTLYDSNYLHTHTLIVTFVHKDPEYRHGVSTSKTDEDAKQLIYAANTNCDEDKYSEPGQQKMRQYDWPSGVDCNSTFGVKMIFPIEVAVMEYLVLCVEKTKTPLLMTHERLIKIMIQRRYLE